MNVHVPDDIDDDEFLYGSSESATAPAQAPTGITFEVARQDNTDPGKKHEVRESHLVRNTPTRSNNDSCFLCSFFSLAAESEAFDLYGVGSE